MHFAAGVIAAGTWVGAIIQRYADWRAIEFIEERVESND
jgi:hypothetical protein